MTINRDFRYAEYLWLQYGPQWLGPRYVTKTVGAGKSWKEDAWVDTLEVWKVTVCCSNRNCIHVMFIFALETTRLTVRRDATQHGSSQCAHDDDETAGAQEMTTATPTGLSLLWLEDTYLRPLPHYSMRYFSVCPLRWWLLNFLNLFPRLLWGLNIRTCKI